MTNEAAERLRGLLPLAGRRQLDEALADERRAAGKRIREAWDGWISERCRQDGTEEGQARWVGIGKGFRNILDEEAAR